MEAAALAPPHDEAATRALASALAVAYRVARRPVPVRSRRNRECDRPQRDGAVDRGDPVRDRHGGVRVRLARVAEAKLDAKNAAPAPAQAVPWPRLRGRRRRGRAAKCDGPPMLRADARRLRPRPLRLPARRRSGIGRSTMLVGFVLHVVGVVTRGIDAGHPPWSSMYEFTITGTMVAVGVFLLVQRKRDITYIAPAVAGFAAFAVVTARCGFGTADAVGLQPALDSYWLVIHVPIAIIASGNLRGVRCRVRAAGHAHRPASASSRSVAASSGG